MIDSQTIFEIAELAMNIADDIKNKKAGEMDTGDSLVELAKRTINACEKQTGQPFDLSLIRLEQPL
jgi:hypothetical protein